MSYIYIDESGDLGTKKFSSKYFVIVGVKVENPITLDRVINKTRRSVKKKLLTSNEIKGSNLPYELKLKIFKKLKNVNYETFILVFEKINRYKIGYGYDNKELYDILASELAKLITITNPTFIFIDKSKNKNYEILKFNQKFLENLINYKNQPITIEYVNSMHFKGLQIADLISWSIFQSFEHDNNEFSRLIKNKTIKELYKN